MIEHVNCKTPMGHEVLCAVAVVIACGIAGCGGGTQPSPAQNPTSPTTPAPPSASAFTVADVKPHYGCSTEPAGQDRVRQYVGELIAKKFGIITLNQMQFKLERPAGYNAFGGVCFAGWADNVAVLFDETQFEIRGVLGTTSNWDVDGHMPFLSDGQSPGKGSMCVAASVKISGERAYTGAVLLHKGSNSEVCVVAGTFPHCDEPWSADFLSNIHDTCGSRQLLIIADTNAGCPFGDGPAVPAQGANGTLVSVQEIGSRHSAGWGACSDPGPAGDKTCCNDTLKSGSPAPQFWFDRTALCRGGRVSNFEVHPTYVCGCNEEHRFTTAVVDLVNHEYV